MSQNKSCVPFTKLFSQIFMNQNTWKVTTQNSKQLLRSKRQYPTAMSSWGKQLHSRALCC